MKHPYTYKIITIAGDIKEGEIKASSERMATTILKVMYPLCLIVRVHTKTPSNFINSGYFANFY